MSGPLQEVTSVQGLPSSELDKDELPTLSSQDVNTIQTPSLIDEQGSNAVVDDNDDVTGDDLNTENNDYEDDFDDFTEFASASENIVITNENPLSGSAAIGNEFADFSKCDTPREHNKTISLDEISSVFASTFGSSIEQEASSPVSVAREEEPTKEDAPSTGKHLSHWLNDSR